MGQCHPVFEQLGPRYDLSQYKGSQDEESKNNFNILAKIKHLLAGYIFCTKLWTKLLAQYFSSFIDIAISALFDFITRPVMKKSESIVSSIIK